MTKEKGILQRIKRAIFGDEIRDTPVSPVALRIAQNTDPRRGLYAAWTDPGREPGLHYRSKRVLKKYAYNLYVDIEAYVYTYSYLKHEAFPMLRSVVNRWRELDQNQRSILKREMPLLDIYLYRLADQIKPINKHEKDSE